MSIRYCYDLLKNFSLFNMKDNTEYEANAFASHILLDNDEVYSLARQGCDVVQISQTLGSHINLMLIKLLEMNKLGMISASLTPQTADFSATSRRRIWRGWSVMSEVTIRVYVTVKASFDSEGRITPTSVIWEEDREYVIDKVTDIQQTAVLRTGGQGDWYTIIVNGRQTYLFFERFAALTGNNIGRWFVERWKRINGGLIKGRLA